MPRARRSATTLAAAAAAVGGAAAICVAATAAGAMTRGTLTAAEYKQLSAVTAALNLSTSSKSVDWSRARAACASTGRATALLRTQGASCLDSLRLLEALTNFPAEQQRCAATKPTSTGSTTTASTTGGATGTSAAVIRLMVCLNPRYQALDRYARALYAADTAARKQALLRGFTGSCLATLAATPADLRKERQFASATVKLAADVTLLIRITDGKAPASDFSQARINADVRRFEATATAVLSDHGEQRLPSCPHE
ncbi:MAG: hypothetical protein KGL15_03320 [Acidobacteriota bacterium]|nr:hypothetical protein [Acidobacteriota bacterium]